MVNDLPHLVPKVELDPENGSIPSDGPSGSGAPVSINVLKTTVAADLEKLQEMYESKIKAKCEENMKVKNELSDMKLERDLYSDKCKSLGRETLKLKEIIAEQEEEIGTLKTMNKARLDSPELVQYNPLVAPVIPPPAQFVDNPQVILLDSDSEENESEISAETSPSLNTPASLNQTSKARSKARKIACLEARMEKVMAKPNPWKCSICSEMFATTQNLQNHVKVAHHKNYKHFCKQCPYFSKYYPDKCKHERAHQENERKYKHLGGRQCKLCNTWYSQRYYGQHLRLYHGE